MLYIIGITITFFLAFILLSKTGKSTADKILSIWLLLIGIHLVLYYLFLTKKYFLYPFLLGFELPLPLVHGPLVYLYAAFLTRQVTYRGYTYLHFLPILLTYLLFADFFFLPSGEKIVVYQQQGLTYAWRLIIHQIAVFLSGPIYVVLSLILLRRHRKKIVSEFSDLEKINLAWLNYLVLGIAVTWIFVFIGNDEYVFGAVVIYVLFIGYFGIKQVGVFTNMDYIKSSVVHQETSLGDFREENYSNEGSEIALVPPKGKYHKSGLNEKVAESIHHDLKFLMQTEKCFRDGALTLTQLSQKLNVHPNNLSQVINSLEGKNFYDYINDQRVEEFKQLVKQAENQKYTLLYLAYECGFNSKTSFNRNFKNVTGFSPSEYLKQINISLAKD
jgi:AraC-like DNA-binding protein